MYKQLSWAERHTVWWLKRQSASIRSIAQATARSPSTISRELRRNQDKNWATYMPNPAQELACQRKHKQKSKAAKDRWLWDYIVQHLHDGWSPEMIVGRLRREHKEAIISVEAVYQFVYSRDGQRMELYKLLTRRRSKRGVKVARGKRKQSLPNCVSIHERPKHIEKREEIGHFEADTVFCSSQSANIASIIERKTRFVFLTKNKSKHSHVVMQSIANVFAQLPAQMRRSVTFDRGSENSTHGVLAQRFGMKTFFCDSHSPWQKGQVENINSFIRRFLPRTTNVCKMSDQQLVALQQKINSLPRKCLGFMTPKEALVKNMKKMEVIYG